MFFIKTNLLFPPNRFRPESQGGFGGGGNGDKAFLHAHSAMLCRFFNLNLALKETHFLLKRVMREAFKDKIAIIRAISVRNGYNFKMQLIHSWIHRWLRKLQIRVTRFKIAS
jgi:hypothetical protein